MNPRFTCCMAETPVSPRKQQCHSLSLIILEDYRSGLVAGLSEAWESARQCIAKAQKKRKSQHDGKARPARYKVGDRVMVFMPQETQWEAMRVNWHCPTTAAGVTNTATVTPVDKPDIQPIRVNLDRLSRCSEELPNVSWLGPRSRRTRTRRRGRRKDSPEDV